jgi:hypothetical protein
MSKSTKRWTTDRPIAKVTYRCDEAKCRRHITVTVSHSKGAELTDAKVIETADSFARHTKGWLNTQHGEDFCHIHA